MKKATSYQPIRSKVKFYFPHQSKQTFIVTHGILIQLEHFMSESGLPFPANEFPHCLIVHTLFIPGRGLGAPVG